MSAVDLFDTAQRLRAAATGAPVPRAAYAPSLAPLDPVAVVLERVAGEPVLHAATSTATATGRGGNALAALRALGVDLADTHRTLVIANLSTLAALAALAREAAGAHTVHAESAAVVAWWDQRGDHPGTGAVLPVAAACALRWALGTAARAERDVQTWRTWLGVTSTGPQALLELADRVSADASLPGLQQVRDADIRSWLHHRERLADGWDWRRPDTRAQAALGLATRDDATELYASLRLQDPLVALRESHTGNIVTGNVVTADKKHVVVESQQPVCRLRPDSEVQGWSGAALDVPAAGNRTTPKLDAALREVTVSPRRRLILSLTDVVQRHGSIKVGDLVTLRTAAVDPYQQQRGRSNSDRHYRAPGNWLGRRAVPQLQRRPVPLDVVVQAAEDE